MKLNYSNNIKQWLGYLKDRLTVQERHELEQEMNRDPFLQDAMDGFSKIQPDELKADLLLLQDRLSAQPKKKKLPVNFIRVAASIALLVTLSGLLWYFIKQPTRIKQLAQETTIKSKSNEQTSTPLIHEPSQIAKETPEQELKPKKVESSDSKTIKSKNFSTAKKESNPFNTNPETIPLILAEPAVNKANEDVVHTQFKNNERNSDDTMVDELSSIEQRSESTVVNTPPIRIRGVSNIKTIKGRVLDANTKDAIPGVTISTEKNITTSNTEGAFQIAIFSDSLVRFTLPGMDEQLVNINKLDSEEIIIEIQPSTLALDELVVAGNEKERKKLFARSTGTLKTEQTIEFDQKHVAGVSANPQAIVFKKFELTYETNFQKHAQPNGGIKKLETYFGENLKMSESLPAPITIEFVVTAEGNILNFSVFQAPDAETSNQFFQLLLNGPIWNPATNKDGATDEKVKLVVWY